jgi:hypothetical protein
MRARHACIRLLVGALVLGVALTGCGKSPVSGGAGRSQGVVRAAGVGAVAISGLATKNTTRLGGAGPVADAAAVALTVDPGLTPATRPGAVVLVDEHDWPAALAAAALASPPLGAPLLYSDGNSLPAISKEALTALRPSGSGLLGGAQVIEIGTTAAPAGYVTRSLSAEAAGGEANTGTGTGGKAAGVRGAGAADDGQGVRSAALAAGIERLVARARGGAPHRVIVIGVDGPPALAMPAAGLAAESGAPILPVDALGIPSATRKALARLHRPTIYVIGPAAAVSQAVLAKLGRFGAVRRIAGEAGADPVLNAIAVARFADGAFGWGVEEPGHGLVFAGASRPLDAPAAASLSASGDYGPLLLLERPDRLPPELAKFLSDIQPAAPEGQPARGVYNHGWLIGDEQAIGATTQAEIDTLLEISLHTGSSTPAIATP